MLLTLRYGFTRLLPPLMQCTAWPNTRPHKAETCQTYRRGEATPQE